MCLFISVITGLVVISWDRANYIFLKVTKMGSMFGHRIDYNGVGVLRGQRHVPSKNSTK